MAAVEATVAVATDLMLVGTMTIGVTTAMAIANLSVIAATMTMLIVSCSQRVVLRVSYSALIRQH